LNGVKSCTVLLFADNCYRFINSTSEKYAKQFNKVKHRDENVQDMTFIMSNSQQNKTP